MLSPHESLFDYSKSFIRTFSSTFRVMDGSFLSEARFKIRGVRRIFFYCNRDGLFSIDPLKDHGRSVK
jgi:hypothetical protein